MPKHRGAGILPYAIHNDKLYFLLGRENPGSDPKKNNLFSDFGGGTEKNETPEQTAFREFTEETMGIYEHLDITLDEKQSYNNGLYYQYMVKIPYSEAEPRTYNSMMSMLSKCRRKKRYKNGFNSLIPTCNTGLAEKTEIKWWTAEEIFQNKKMMRPLFLKTFNQVIKNLEK